MEEAHLRLTSWVRALQRYAASPGTGRVAGLASSVPADPWSQPPLQREDPCLGPHGAVGVVTADTRSVGPQGTGLRVAGGLGSPWHIPGS